MANKRKAVIDALVTVLDSIAGVTQVTYVLPPPDSARDHNSGFIGLVSGNEVIQVEDATHVRFATDARLILDIQGHNPETVLDLVKGKIFAVATLTTIGALALRFVRLERVGILESEERCGAILDVNIVYAATKGAF